MIDIALPGTDAPYWVMASLPHGVASRLVIRHRVRFVQHGPKAAIARETMLAISPNSQRTAAGLRRPPDVRWRELLCVSAFTLVSLRYADGQFRSRVETILVTGETPIVDVQSVRAQQTVSKDVLAGDSRPRARGAAFRLSSRG